MNEAIFEAMPAIIFVQGADGTFLEWRGRRANLRFEPEQFLGRRFRDVFPEPFSDLVEGHLKRVLERDAPVYFEYLLEDASGEARAYECRMVPLEAGKVLSLITERAAPPAG